MGSGRPSCRLVFSVFTRAKRKYYQIFYRLFSRRHFSFYIYFFDLVIFILGNKVVILNLLLTSADTLPRFFPYKEIVKVKLMHSFISLLPYTCCKICATVSIYLFARNNQTKQVLFFVPAPTLTELNFLNM